MIPFVIIYSVNLHHIRQLINQTVVIIGLDKIVICLNIGRLRLCAPPYSRPCTTYMSNIDRMWHIDSGQVNSRRAGLLVPQKVTLLSKVKGLKSSCQDHL